VNGQLQGLHGWYSGRSVCTGPCDALIVDGTMLRFDPSAEESLLQDEGFSKPWLGLVERRPDDPGSEFRSSAGSGNPRVDRTRLAGI